MHESATSTPGIGARAKPQPVDPRLGERRFFDQLTPAERTELHALGRTFTAPRGAILMYEGEPAERVLILLAGRVKVTCLADNGIDTLIGIRDPGDLLGEVSWIDGGPRLGTITTLEQVEALAITSAAFRAYVTDSVHVRDLVLQLLAQRIREVTLAVMQLSTSDALGRLAARLTELSQRYGQTCEYGLMVTLPLTQEELTAWTGASRASVAKALQTFRQLGWIETHRRHVLIRDPDALRLRAA